jgi:ribose transport system permease protein
MTTDHGQRTRVWPRRLQSRLPQSEYLVLYLSVAYFLAASCFIPDFASTGNTRNIFSNMLPLLAVAIGQTVVLITGGIDLSVTSVIGLASIAGAWVMNTNTGLLAGHAMAVPLGICAMLAVGAGVGLVNGLAISRLRMPPFIVTLTTMMFFSGLAIWLTRSRNISGLPGGFIVLGYGTWLGIPLALVLSGSLAIVMHILLGRTLWGRWIYAIGHNVKTAAISGVPVERTMTKAYLVSGFCAAIASILYTARLETGLPTLGQGHLLDIIGAVVIGGTSLFGGKGKILWTVVGVAFITVIVNSLNTLGLSYFAIMIAKGTIILLAALIDALQHKRVGG